MVRQYEGKVKLKGKPAKKTRTRRGKKLSHRTKVDASSNSECDYTLPDDYHHDSFDRLRLNAQP